MTKRDFELIARAISGVLDDCMNNEQIGGVSLVVDRLTWELYQVNPRFDRARFMKACGFGEDR